MYTYIHIYNILTILTTGTSSWRILAVLDRWRYDCSARVRVYVVYIYVCVCVCRPPPLSLRTHLPNLQSLSLSLSLSLSPCTVLRSPVLMHRRLVLEPARFPHLADTLLWELVRACVCVCVLCFGLLLM